MQSPHGRVGVSSHGSWIFLIVNYCKFLLEERPLVEAAVYPKEEWENAALQVLAPSVHPEGGAHL